MTANYSTAKKNTIKLLKNLLQLEFQYLTNNIALFITYLLIKAIYL